VFLKLATPMKMSRPPATATPRLPRRSLSCASGSSHPSGEITARNVPLSMHAPAQQHMPISTLFLVGLLLGEWHIQEPALWLCCSPGILKAVLKLILSNDDKPRGIHATGRLCNSLISFSLQSRKASWLLVQSDITQMPLSGRLLQRASVGGHNAPIQHCSIWRANKRG